MLAVLHLAASLCTGFPIIYTPDWNLMPEVSATPTTPQPEHALLLSDTVRFVTRYDTDISGDTTFLAWDPVQKDLVEERAYAQPNFLTGSNASRTVLHRVDPDANRKGLALARSDTSWIHDSTGWKMAVYLTHKDSSGIDIFLIRRKPYLNDEWYSVRIREAKHSSGYIAWRDSAILDDTGWITMGRDEIDRTTDGTPVATRTYRNQDYTEPILFYANILTWKGKLLVRMESHIGGTGTASQGMYRANYAWSESGKLLSREDSGAGYSKVSNWIRNAAGLVVEQNTTVSYSSSLDGSELSWNAGRIVYTYDSDNRLSRMDAFLKTADTAAWWQEKRESYTYDTKNRVTSTTTGRYCSDYESDSCTYYKKFLTYLDAPWRVGVRQLDGSRPHSWKTSIQNGSFVLEAEESTPASLEIVRLDGIRLFTSKGRGKITSPDLHRWKGSPLLWRGLIDGTSISGSIVLP
jgi:hypothetical protein